MFLNLNNSEKIELLNAIENYPDRSDEVKVKKLTNLQKKIEKSMKPIKVRSAKNKGLSWQKKVCELISELTVIPYDQASDDCLIHSRESGLNGTDIVLRGKAKELFPYSVECKCCDSISLPQWISQAKDNSDKDYPWLLFIHSQVLEDKEVVVMSVETFKEIYK